LLFMLALGLWGLVRYLRGGALDGSIAGALVIGWVLIVVQGAMGLIRYIEGPRPADPVHILYGITAALALPFVFTYTRDRNARQALLLYSLVSLFIAGLAIRGMTTGT
jgi:multisubunit Na+/H+ antiporter MnhF subunit